MCCRIEVKPGQTQSLRSLAWRWFCKSSVGWGGKVCGKRRQFLAKFGLRCNRFAFGVVGECGSFAGRCCFAGSLAAVRRKKTGKRFGWSAVNGNATLLPLGCDVVRHSTSARIVALCGKVDYIGSVVCRVGVGLGGQVGSFGGGQRSKLLTIRCVPDRLIRVRGRY